MDKALEIYKRLKQSDTVVHIKEAVRRDGEYSKAYPIGYDVFDKAILGGVREGDLIIGTGISGHGKTLAFQNITVNLSKAGHSCLWFSYEVIIDNLYAKFRSMGIDTDSLLLYAPKQNTSGALDWLQEKIKESYDKYHTKFVFIDHIDYLTPKKVRSTDQLRMILSNVCAELKTMAISMNIIIFLIAHVKKVQGRAIEMQDIGESSGIFKLADLILGVTRNSSIQRRNGQKYEVYEKISTLRTLKNRISGDQAIMDFIVENNIIIPLKEEITNNPPVKYYNETEKDYEIEIVDNAIQAYNVDVKEGELQNALFK